MKKNWAIWLVISAGLLLAGCAKNEKADTEAAVRRAIEEHLASRPGLASSDIVMDMKSVQVQGDRAEAGVLFRSRSDPKATMNFQYQLHKEGNRWKVDETRPNAAGSPHGMPSEPGDGSPPPSHSSFGSGQSLPQGHPPVGNRRQGSAGNNEQGTANR